MQNLVQLHVGQFWILLQKIVNDWVCNELYCTIYSCKKIKQIVAPVEGAKAPVFMLCTGLPFGRLSIAGTVMTNSYIGCLRSPVVCTTPGCYCDVIQDMTFDACLHCIWLLQWRQ